MIQNDIEQLISPSITDMGYELWGLEYISQGRHSLLRIYIDAQNGIKLEDCEKVSKRVSALLDVEDPITSNYTLEVSSPGIERPLFKSYQYQRYQGQKIQIKLFKPQDGKRKFVGEIISADETLVLNIDNVQQEFQFTNIVKANLIV